jgi:hypothetical protein
MSDKWDTEAVREGMSGIDIPEVELEASAFSSTEAGGFETDVDNGRDAVTYCDTTGAS